MLSLTISYCLLANLCAPPSTSVTISSIIPNFLQSCAVNFNASAASLTKSALLQRIEEHPSGEITE